MDYTVQSYQCRSLDFDNNTVIVEADALVFRESTLKYTVTCFKVEGSHVLTLLSMFQKNTHV